jgi:hypothetical protein
VSAAFTVGAKGTVGQLYDVVETWSGKAKDIRGEALPCGHSPHEEIPEIFFTVFSLFSEQCYNAPVLLNFLTDYEKNIVGKYYRQPHEGWPSVEDLQVFITVARNGSFSRAALELGQSASYISKRIALLEKT